MYAVQRAGRKKGPKPLESDDPRLPEGVVTPVGRVGVLVADDLC
jgi:hypothetical protein